MMLFLAVLTLGFALFLVAEVVTLPQHRRHVALKRAASYGSARHDSRPELPRFKERVLLPAIERLAGLALRANPKVSADAIGEQWARAYREMIARTATGAAA